jgi:hypothetical protein
MAISEYLIDSNSKVFAATVKHQSSNGLVKSHWKTMVHMGCAYLTEKQMPRTFWFYAISHAARMMNAVPGMHLGYLAFPFLFVHGVRHDEQTWIPLFSLCYFHHVHDGNQKRSKHQAHTMDGIVIGRSPTSNALFLYIPWNKQYFEPDSYHLDSYRLPTLVYPDIKYNGGLFYSLVHDNNPTMEEKYPPGTCLERMDPATNLLLAKTVMDISFLMTEFNSGGPVHNGSYQYYFIMGHPPRFHFLIWLISSHHLLLFLCLILLPHLRIHYCLHSYVLTPTSRTNTTVNTIRASLNNGMVFIASSSNLM